MDDNWPEVVESLWKARSRWARLSRILGQEGADPWKSVTFYKALVQANLLLGLETWEMTPRIGRNLGRFHHRMERCLVGMQPTRDMSGRWEYQPLGEAMAELGLEEVETYVLHHHKNMA